MLRLMLLLFCFHQSKGYGVKLQGKVEVGDNLGIILQDLLNHYLREGAAGHTKVDIGKIVNDFQNLAGESPPTVKKAESDDDTDETREIENHEADPKNKKHHKSKKSKDDSESDKETRDDTEEDLEKEAHKANTNGIGDKKRKYHKTKKASGDNNYSGDRNEKNHKSREESETEGSDMENN